jgi:hypothetical protein
VIPFILCNLDVSYNIPGIDLIPPITYETVISAIFVYPNSLLNSFNSACLFATYSSIFYLRAIENALRP